MKTAIVILNFNDYKTTKNLLEMIKKYEAFSHIVVVDNKSTEGDYDKLLEYSSEKIIVLQASGNNGYSCGNNVGIRWVLNNTDDEIIAISNSDVEFDEKFVETIIGRFKNNPEYSVITGLQLSPKGELASHPFWFNYTNKQYFKSKMQGLRLVYYLTKNKPDIEYAKRKLHEDRDFFEVGAVEGSLFFIRSNDLKKIGLLDENVFIYNEEDILAKKISKINKKIGVDKSVHYIHYGAITTQKVFTSKTKINHIYNSAIYYFNNYQSKNKILQLLNLILCFTIKIESRIVMAIKKR